jgi:hypothetical protein
VYMSWKTLVKGDRSERLHFKPVYWPDKCNEDGGICPFDRWSWLLEPPSPSPGLFFIPVANGWRAKARFIQQRHVWILMLHITDRVQVSSCDTNLRRMHADLLRDSRSRNSLDGVGFTPWPLSIYGSNMWYALSVRTLWCNGWQACNTSLVSRRTFSIVLEHTPRRFESFCFLLQMNKLLLCYWAVLAWRRQP